MTARAARWPSAIRPAWLWAGVVARPGTVDGRLGGVRIGLRPGRRVSGRAVVVTAAWMAIACAVQGWLWFARPVGVPRNPPAGQTLTLPRDGGEARLAQTFRLDTDGFNELTLYPVVKAGTGTALAAAGTAGAANAGSGVRADARVELTLSDVSDDAHPRVIHRATVGARELAASDRCRLSFPPVPDSTGRLFELEIAIIDGGTGADAGSGGPPNAAIAFTSVAENVYRAGALRVNGRPEWGDLAFEARATEDTPFRLFLARALPAGWPRSEPLWIALLLGYNALCAALLWSLISPVSPSPSPPRQRSQPRQAPGESAA